MEDPTMQKQRNYFRLANLILELGTEVIRTVILRNLKNETTLDSVLANNGIRSQLQQLYDNKIIDKGQWSILYPSGGDGKADLLQIDITLWLILMHNLILINGPGRRLTWVSAILEVKNVRNELFHLPNSELEDLSFSFLWNKATTAMFNLDSRSGQDCFDHYRNKEIDAKKMADCQRRITVQVLQEHNFQLHLENGHLGCPMASLFSVLIFTVTALAYFAFLNVYFSQVCIPSNKHRFKNKCMIRFVSRREWKASPPNDDVIPLEKPASLVIYTHTANTEECQVSDNCCATVNDIQYAHMHLEHDPCSDIAFHYIIDSYGNIYEGRSTNFRPSAAEHWNNYTITIALTENNMYESITQGGTISAFSILLDWLVQSKILSTDYTMYGMCAVSPFDNPDVNLYSYSNGDKINFPRVQQRNDILLFQQLSHERV